MMTARVRQVFPNKITVQTLESSRGCSPTVTVFGGSGSGNFGHKGRPGKVGGSGKGRGARATPSDARMTAGTAVLENGKGRVQIVMGGGTDTHVWIQDAGGGKKRLVPRSSLTAAKKDGGPKRAPKGGDPAEITQKEVLTGSATFKNRVKKAIGTAATVATTLFVAQKELKTLLTSKLLDAIPGGAQVKEGLGVVDKQLDVVAAGLAKLSGKIVKKVDPPARTIGKLKDAIEGLGDPDLTKNEKFLQQLLNDAHEAMDTFKGFLTKIRRRN